MPRWRYNQEREVLYKLAAKLILASPIIRSDPSWCRNQQLPKCERETDHRRKPQVKLVPGSRRVVMIVQEVSLGNSSREYEKIKPTCAECSVSEQTGRPRGKRIKGSCGKHLWTPQ
ncbi:hypothetical protein TNCV_418531 [Trichonephila clavipes]|nr:hypothetical protein TNCV_418531 [Trichonephila clavipes]